MSDAAVAERWVKHPAAKVWRALTVPALAESWLPFDGYRPEVGARFTARGPDGLAVCEVVEVVVPRRVVCRWTEGSDTSILTLELHDDVGGTRIVVRHTAPEEGRRRRLHTIWLAALSSPLDVALVSAVPVLVSTGPGLATVGLAVVLAGAVGVGVGAFTLGGSGSSPPPSERPMVARVVAEPAPPSAPATSPRELGEERLEAGPPLALPPLPPEGAVRVTEVALPTTLNPLYPVTEVDHRVHRLVWDPLFERAAITGEIRSSVVEVVEGSGPRLRVRVRDGVAFHDGHLADAEDVCFSVHTVLDPSLPVQLAVARRGDLVGCEVVDSRTADLLLRGPMPDAELRASVPLLPSHAFDPSSDSLVSVRPVGSGPYRGERGRRAVRFTAVPGTHHSPGIQVLSLEGGGDPLVQAKSVVAGLVHGVVDVPRSMWSEVSASDDVMLKHFDTRGVLYLALSPVSLADPALRASIEAAIDRAELRTLALGEADDGFPAAWITGPFVPSSPSYNRAVPARSGSGGGTAPPGAPPLRLGVATSARVEVRVVAETLASQLRRAGFRVSFERADAPTGFDLWVDLYTADLVDDPGSTVSPTVLGARSERVDAMLSRMRLATTFTQRQDAAHDLHARVAEERWWVGLFRDQRRSAWRNEVRKNILTPGSYWAEVDGWQVR